MDLDKARKILWPDYNVLSDEQVLQIIDLFKALSLVLIEREAWNV